MTDSEDSHFKDLAMCIDGSRRAMFGGLPCDIKAIGCNRSGRWVMAVGEDGTVTVGEPHDFIVISDKENNP